MLEAMAWMVGTWIFAAFLAGFKDKPDDVVISFMEKGRNKC